MTNIGGAPAARIPADLIEEYASARPESHQRFEQAKQVYPGGETRAVTHYAPFPTILVEGHGSELLDVDGHRYLDLVNNYTSLVHGNAYPPISAAITEAAANGTVFASIHPAQLALAEALVERIPAIESLRLTNSGSEASALALRIARRVTGRRILAVVEGGYHGAVPPFTPDEPEVRRLRFGRIEDIATAIDEGVAAVFIEPFLGAGGVIELEPAYLRAIQERARAVGAVFVLDEVQSLRNTYHGEAARLGLDPDLITVAKIIGGGLPIGGVGGRRELLEVTSPLRADRLEHAGTFNGHVAAAAAGLVSLEHLTPAAIERLQSQATVLSEGILAAGRSTGFPVDVTRAGSIINVHPGDIHVTSPQEAKRYRLARSALHLALMVDGVYTSPRGMINLSTVLREEDLGTALDAYERAFRRLAPEADQLLAPQPEAAAS